MKSYANCCTYFVELYREIKKRPKPSRGPVNISRQSSRTPLLEGGDTATSETDDTTDSEVLCHCLILSSTDHSTQTCCSTLVIYA